MNTILNLPPDEEHEIVLNGILSLFDSLTDDELGNLHVDNLKRVIQALLCFHSGYAGLENPGRIRITLLKLWRVFVNSDKVSALWFIIGIVLKDIRKYLAKILLLIKIL